MFDRLLRSPRFVQEDAQVDAGLEIIGFQAQGLLKMFDCLPRPIRIVQRDAQAVVD